MGKTRVSFHVEMSAGTTVMTREYPAEVDRPGGMDGWILNVTVQGRGRVGPENQQGQCFYAEVGDILLFPPDIPHDYGFASQKGLWGHLWVYFFPRQHWSDWLHWPVRSGNVLAIPISDLAVHARIVRQTTDVLEIIRGGGPRWLDLAMNALEETILLCDQASSVVPVRNPRIIEVLSLIHERFGRPITLQALARAAEVSTSRLSHMFREEMGVSPMHYLERYRMQRARELLLLTGMSITQIGYEVGFADPYHFSRVFRRATDQSPRDFRSRHRS